MTFEQETSSTEHYQDDLVYEDDMMASVPINYYKRALWLTSPAVVLSLIGALGIFGAIGNWGTFGLAGAIGVAPLACTFGYLAAKNAARALHAGEEHKYFKTLRVLAFVPFALLLSLIILLGYLAMMSGGWFIFILIGMVPSMALGSIVSLVVALFVSHKLRKNNNDTEPRDGKTKIIRIILLVPITLAVCAGGYLVYLWILFANA
jgi:uncharacterized membrane protein